MRSCRQFMHYLPCLLFYFCSSEERVSAAAKDLWSIALQENDKKKKDSGMAHGNTFKICIYNN